MQYVLSEKGKKLLLHKGYLFYHDKTVDSTTYWKCENVYKLKCRARIVSVDCEIKKENQSHNHSAVAVDVSKRIFLNELKSAAVEQDCTSLQHIIANKSQYVSENVAAKLPPISSLKRNLRHFRNEVNNDPPVPNNINEIDVPDYLRYSRDFVSFI